MNKYIVIISVILLNGCATIFSGTTQNINLIAVDAENNQPLENTVCSIVDGQGVTYPLISNPGSVLVNKGKGSLMPQCRKTGYSQRNHGVGENFNAITIANVLFWPGFIVDVVSGSMQKYPSYITVFMEKKAAN